ncbi:hypothetical protein L1987_74649 [Smallanthus sonchifolius]|uniref:Uncharacterized protein n=1 Tax=Smallanthus sonchifolius TaxID=185202 RepID=A0ACB9A2J7_9ASTR|nr:hypothetical protein L1987_74649 [Smallanthus sonchifolius]
MDRRERRRKGRNDVGLKLSIDREKAGTTQRRQERRWRRMKLSIDGEKVGTTLESTQGNDGGIHTATSELPDSKQTSTDTNVNNLTGDSNPSSTDIPVDDSADHLKANVTDNPPESRDSVEPSDIITEPAGPSLSRCGCTGKVERFSIYVF